MRRKFWMPRRAGHPAPYPTRTNNTARLLATATATAAVATAAGVAAATYVAPALAAATNPYTARDVCGSGYRELEHQRISGAVIYLMWNGSANCVATMKTSNIGKKTETEAILEVKSPRGFYSDDGKYAYYAVIKEYAAGSCIKWGGMTTAAIWESPTWGHCG